MVREGNRCPCGNPEHCCHCVLQHCTAWNCRSCPPWHHHRAGIACAAKSRCGFWSQPAWNEQVTVSPHKGPREAGLWEQNPSKGFVWLSVSSLQQNQPRRTHSPNLLLLMKHHFSSPLLLPAALLFNPRQRCLTPWGGLERGTQNGVTENRQHFRWFHIFYFQVLFVLYKQNTAPNNWPQFRPPHFCTGCLTT